MPAVIVLGAQWGDEGKGKATDQLGQHTDLVVKFNGGSNAGHTVVIDGEKYALHLLPAGILSEGVTPIIGNGVVVDLDVLFEELAEITERGVDCSRLLISSNAHIIPPYNRLMDQANERARGNNLIGTTGRGIGPTYADKMNRIGLRIQDLFHPEELRAKVEAAAAQGEVRGTLTIGVIPTVTAVDVAAVLGQFHRRHPDVRVHVRSGGSDAFLHRIADGRLDAAFLGLAEAVIPQDVRTRELTRERLVAVLPSEHQLAKRRRLHLEDLADEPFVDFPAGSSGREQSDLAFQEAGLRREVSFEVTTAELLTDLVHQGLGVALIAPSVAREVPGCACVAVSDGPVRVEYVAWGSFNPSPAAQAFIDFVPAPSRQPHQTPTPSSQTARTALP